MQRFPRSIIFDAESLPLMVNRSVQHEDHWAHDHDDFMEIAVVVDGHGVHQSHQGEQRIGAGDVFILRPNAWHAYKECEALDYYNCCFGTEVLQRELKMFVQNPAIHYLFWSGPLALDRRGIIHLHLLEDSLEVCKQHLDAILEMGYKRTAYNHIAQMGHLLLLLSELARHLHTDYSQHGNKASAVHEAVTRGIHLLESQLSRQWNLTDLAQELFLHPSYLSRLFKESTGLAPLEYLAHIRAERAASLLIRSDLSISDIGLQVGWHDPNYMYRRFKAHFGISAKQYRQQFAQRNIERSSA